MASRLQLHNKLVELLGSKNVYYQPPESIKMEYPAIVYSRSKIDSAFADNTAYMLSNKYEIIVIDMKPDNNIINHINSIPYCRHDRCYKADNLYHDVFILYY